MKKVFKKIGIFILILAILPLGGISVYAAEGNGQKDYVEEKTYCNATLKDDFADDRVLIVLNKETSLSYKTYQPDDFSDIGCTDIKDLTEATGELVRDKLAGKDIGENPSFQINTETFRRILCLELKTKSKENVLSVIEKLEKRGDILSAEPDYIMSICATASIEPYYLEEEQWAINKIDLPNAWDIIRDASSITVGILDTGIDWGHEDLVGRINTGLCRRFTSGNTAVENPPTDPHGHGTHAAGIVGAHGFNATGITGVCWDVTLVSLKVLNGWGRGYSSNAAKAIVFATQQRIPILNCSVGWYRNTDEYDDNGALYTAFQNYPGLLVCAAGNEGINNDGTSPLYPASYNLDNIISVGASTSSDTKKDSSNFGKTTVDIFAPGEGILSTYPMQKCSDGSHDITYSIHFANGYHKMNGTSMAAPFVTGVAALLLAINPDLSASHMKDIILSNADWDEDLDPYCVSGGRLNAYNVISTALSHNYYYYSSINDQNHTKLCSCCGHSEAVPHKWNYYPDFVQCDDCGHIIWIN